MTATHHRAGGTECWCSLPRRLDWHAINWRRTFRIVRRLQVRIVKAYAAPRHTGVWKGLSRISGN